MIQGELKVRVRYSETDKMGVVYYGNYAQYFEIGRVELMREVGITYKELEDQGIMMPVLRFNIEYRYPAKYDDELKVITTVSESPKSRIIFNTEIYNQDKKLICTGSATLAFIDSNFRPVKAPDEILEAIK